MSTIILTLRKLIIIKLNCNYHIEIIHRATPTDSQSNCELENKLNRACTRSRL